MFAVVPNSNLPKMLKQLHFPVRIVDTLALGELSEGPKNLVRGGRKIPTEGH
jgi:hypothetical protein